nr:FxsA family protein [Echinimonas agarilytica]
MLPVIELTLLVQVGMQIGALTTVALTILTAVIGVSLVRSQGLSVMQRAQMNMASGQDSAPEVIEGAMLAFAGVCLLIPGFMTDAVGALLLLPPLRRQFAKSILSSRVIRFGNMGQRRGDTHTSGSTFDAEFERKDDHDRLN